MISKAIQCVCGLRVSPKWYNVGWVPACVCGRMLQVRAYSALAKDSDDGQRSQAVLIDGQASCYNHPQKQAVSPCERCGRFLCPVCVTPLGQHQVCLQCYREELKQQMGTTEANRLIRYDKIALLLAIIPFYGLSAIAAIFIAIRHWNSRLSVLKHSRFRHVLALLLALAQIGIFAWLIIAMTSGVWD